eukprot:403357819
MNSIEELQERINFQNDVIENIQQKLEIPFIAQMLDVNFYRYFPKFQLLKDEIIQLQRQVEDLGRRFKDEEEDQKDESYIEKQITDKTSVRELGILIIQLSKEIRQVKSQVSIQSQKEQEERKESESLKDEVEQNINQEVKISQSDVDFKVQTLMQEVSDLNFKMTNSVSQEQFQLMLNRLNQYAVLQDISRVMAHFENFAKRTELNKTQDKFKKLKKTVKQECVTKEEFQNGIQFVRDEMNKKLEFKLSIDQFNEKLKTFDHEMNRKFHKVNLSISDTNQRIQKVEEDIKLRINLDIQDIYKDLRKKTNNEETSRLWKNFTKYAEYGDLKDLYNKVLPEVSRFEDSLLDLSKEAAKTQEIVRRFDEVMSDKASKQNFREIQLKLEKYVLTETLLDYKSDLNVKFLRFLEKQAKLEENLDVLGSNISKDIYAAVKKISQQIIQKPGSYSNPNQIQITDQEFKNTLDSKANKADLIEIQNQKSNKSDFENIVRWIEALHKFIKNLSVMQIETSKLLMSVPQETEQQKLNKVEFVINQSQIISNWIMKFNLDCLNQYYKNTPPRSALELNNCQVLIGQSVFDSFQKSPINEMEAVEKYSRQDSLPVFVRPRN